jgi:predicted nucleic acid-binding protein
MTILVDSDILIEVCRGKDQEIVSRWQKLSESETVILCTPITIAELWAGALPNEHDLLTRLFNALMCASIDAETGRRAGDYLRQFRRSHAIGLGDALIASASVENQAALWTRNRKHYPMKDVKFY